jgi:diguanylate cyclase (GGDEF)-like protein
MGARLATLTLESSQLYADLLRRSEFDLLTDIHNRFSLEKELDRRIADAHQSQSAFGLIYMDLDGFKQINDRFGHQAGDWYLREASTRMKGVLRPRDMLARLGGDEFAILMIDVRTRAEVEEIAVRIKRCFEDPFSVAGRLVRGSISVGIALYPEDGRSRDNLLHAGDLAMYAAKNAKGQLERRPDASQVPELAGRIRR